MKAGDVMDGYEELANAIIVKAAKDYRTAIRKQRKRPDDRKALMDARALERFFHSRWYRTLTDVDGDFLINQIRKEAAK